MAEQVYSYIEYLQKNPLYLHNSRDDFKSTLTDLNKINETTLKPYLLNYIKYLREEEQKILNALGGGEEGKKALQVLADEVFRSNDNIKKSASFLDELFGRSGEGTVYSRPDRSFNGNIEEIDVITGGGVNPYQKTKINYQQNMFLRIPGGKFHLLAKERRNRHGSLRNVYDFDRSIAEATEQEKQEFIEALNAYITGLNKAFSKYDKILNNLDKYINLDALTTKTGADNTSKALKDYVEGMKNFDGTLTAQFLEFLVAIEGMYYSLIGKFNESSALEVSQRVRDLFGQEFVGARGDQSTGKNKKPDSIYYGGKIDATLNPITVSMKSLKASEKFLKAQTSALMSNQEGSGIINFIANESEEISKILLYLSLNDAFHPRTGALEKIKLIYKYFSYVFLSGSSQDERIDQAVFFTYTQPVDGKVKVEFLSMADILLNILEAIEDPVNIPKLSGNTEKLNELDKIKKSIYNKRQDEINRGKEWGYNFLYNNEEVKNTILNIAGTDVLYKTMQIKFSTSYLSSRGIII